MNNLIITKMDIYNTSNLHIAAALEDFKLKSVDFDCDEQFRIGNIYVGKVKKVVKNIQAAFIDIGEKCQGYLPLSDLTAPFFLNRRSNKKILVEGDELLVQIQKDAIKTKSLMLTTNLSFTGKYLVVTTGKNQLGISKKISFERGIQLKSTMKGIIEENKIDNMDFGVILRTNSSTATDARLLAEYKTITCRASDTINKGLQRTCFSKIYEDVPFIVQSVKNIYMTEIDKIITDDKSFYEEIKSYLSVFQPEDIDKLQFYEDSLLPLYSLYNLRCQLEEITRKKVWLKSGGYLIIEVTEAMIVIDVNTGKFDGKKNNREENFLKINIEAAKEICRQLILRNLSGMILIDFISLQDEENINKLISVLTSELKNDPVKAEFVDITKLGIVEITRKKGKKSIQEKIKQFQTTESATGSFSVC